MRTEIRDLAKRPAGWLSLDAEATDVVLSSRVRVARNLTRWPFPGRAEPHNREAVVSAVRDATAKVVPFANASELAIESLSRGEKRVLCERRLITTELTQAEGARALLIGENETTSAMVNEEDHLRIQALLPGLQLDTAWSLVNEADDGFAESLDYAYHDDFGYLTTCPSNLGTGLRASVMLHLPGLVLSETIAECLNAIQELGLAVRGVFGEGSETTGNIFQLSNQSTLGESEEEIIARLAHTCQQVVTCERHARQRLVESVPARLADFVGRAFGCLRYAHWLTTSETLGYISGLRLGTDLGMFRQIEPDWVNQLWLTIQAGHLQAQDDGRGPRAKRPVRRAALVRQRLAQVTSAD